MHAVAGQQPLDFPGRRNDGVAGAADAAGEQFRQAAAHPAAGGKVVGVILVHGVVGMNQRGTGGFGQLPGRGKGAELALGVDHVGFPGGQGVQGTVQGGGAQPGAGVDQPRIQRTQAGHAVLGIGVAAARQRQHPHLVAAGLQFGAQCHRGSDHPVDGGGPGIRCQ